MRSSPADITDIRIIRYRAAMIAPTPPGYVMDGSHVSVMFVSGMQVRVTLIMIPS